MLKMLLNGEITRLGQGFSLTLTGFCLSTEADEFEAMR